jgi:heavy metal sensor kinase
MSGRSTRTRLMLWYSGVLLLALAIFSLSIYSLLQRDLLKELDQRLTDQTEGVKTLLDHEEFDDLHEELGEFAGTLPAGRLVEVVVDSDKLLVPEQGKQQVPSGLLTSRGARDSGRFRVLVTAIPAQGHQFVVLSAESQDEMRAFMARLRDIMAILAIPVLIAAGLGGQWLSRRALAPVDAMTRAAQSVSLENLSGRLPVPSTGDEIERLAKAWNQLLERLEGSVRRMRQFTADASHELRTPLALIRSTAELALRRERNAEEYRKALRDIEQESQQMTALAESLLELARADANSGADLRKWMPLSPVDVSELVGEVTTHSEPLAGEKGIQLESGDDAGPAVADANPAALRRLLLILVENAFAHTAPGGRVRVTVVRNNGLVQLSVEDNGEGIPPDAMPHIFERFYRANAARGGKGVGLGLSIAQAIAQAHGSQIEVESKLGQGARFHLNLRAVNGDRRV